MVKRIIIWFFAWSLASCLILTTPGLQAHPLGPSLLKLSETSPGQVQVEWKTPIQAIPGARPLPLMPEHCMEISRSPRKIEGRAYLDSWRIRCEAPMVGSTLKVEGIAESKADVILRVALADGRKFSTLLSAQTFSFTVPDREQAWKLGWGYLRLGFEHILSGLDHLLFVLGLVLLVSSKRQLLWTVTAFTLGHSITLSVAALGWVHIPSAPVEALIALSILFLAVEVLRKKRGGSSFFQQQPWAMALAFGLLHGLGFAGALAEVGLPSGDIPLALFSFNLGIELGQLLFIAVILFLGLLLKWLRWKNFRWAYGISAYAMGTLAAFWLFQRLEILF